MEPENEDKGTDSMNPQENKENMDYENPPLNQSINNNPPIPVDPSKKGLPPVEIIYSTNPKPYLGGFKSLKTGLVYHHAFAQTDQIPREHKTKFHRDVNKFKETQKLIISLKNRHKPMNTLQNHVKYLVKSVFKWNERAFILT